MKEFVRGRTHNVVPITLNVVRALGIDSGQIDSGQKKVPAGRLVRPERAGCAVPDG